MKKLMIALGIVAMAAASQAAAMKWTAAAKLPGADGTQTGTAIGSSTANLLTYVWAMDSAISGDIWSAVAKKEGTAYTITAPTGSTDIKTTASWKGTSATYTDGPTTKYAGGDDAYAAIVYVYDANKDGVINDGDYYLANQNTWHFDTDTSKTLDLIKTTSGDWTKISSVPEPTSGLLLLLGVAGLALRRRRA